MGLIFCVLPSGPIHRDRPAPAPITATRQGPRLADERTKAAECLREAAACIEVAERMSVQTDRARMVEMAQRWLDMAKDAEAKAKSGS
jgi:hypothetical protein